MKGRKKEIRKMKNENKRMKQRKEGKKREIKIKKG
jgi:hypothetical protein